jgi:FtsX-like permease family
LTHRAYRDGTRTLSGVTAFTKSWTPAVVLSHALWTRAFAADPTVVQKTITLNGLDVAVVGVAPEGFVGTELTQAAFFAPVSLQPAFYPERNFLDDPQVSWLTLLARRYDGTSLDQVRAELAVVANRIDRQQPGRATTLLVAPATSLSLPVARRDFASVAAIVVAAFGLILLIASANVANVLLARGEARSREIAMRLAVGARRARLVQLLLTESAVIALIGGVAGSLLAWWSFQALLPSMPSSVPGMPQLTLDAHPNLTVLWFGLAITMATAMACGVAPAFRASKQELHSVMKQESPQAKALPAGWLRGALISIQVAVCMVLLISAALLPRALHPAYAVDPGFEYRNVAVVSVGLRGPQYSNAPRTGVDPARHPPPGRRRRPGGSGGRRSHLTRAPEQAIRDQPARPHRVRRRGHLSADRGGGGDRAAYEGGVESRPDHRSEARPLGGRQCRPPVHR